MKLARRVRPLLVFDGWGEGLGGRLGLVVGDRGERIDPGEQSVSLGAADELRCGLERRRASGADLLLFAVEVDEVVGPGFGGALRRGGV